MLRQRRQRRTLLQGPSLPPHTMLTHPRLTTGAHIIMPPRMPRRSRIQAMLVPTPPMAWLLLIGRRQRLPTSLMARPTARNPVHRIPPQLTETKKPTRSRHRTRIRIHRRPTQRPLTARCNTQLRGPLCLLMALLTPLQLTANQATPSPPVNPLTHPRLETANT